MARILDGKILAQKIKDELRYEVNQIKVKTAKIPRIVNTVLGDDHSACAYANSQKRVAQYVGIDYELVTLSKDISQEDLKSHLQSLNEDPDIHGIMLHKPVPAHIEYRAMANCIKVEKDLEGINVANIGNMIIGQTNIIPCTPAAVMEHLKSSGVDLRGKEVVVVGHSEIVGKPLLLLLLNEYATVTVCHIATSEAGNLEEHVGKADVLVVAVGCAALIPGKWIKKGAVVIDVGINSVEGKIVGDVEFDEAEKRASYITPVPGGVGPVTVCMLMRNGVEAFKMQQGGGE